LARIERLPWTWTGRSNKGEGRAKREGLELMRRRRVTVAIEPLQAGHGRDDVQPIPGCRSARTTRTRTKSH